MNNNLNINSKECFSMDTLSQYAHDTLTINDMSIVKEHIDNCIICSKIVEGLTPHKLHSINSIISNVNQKASNKISSKPRNNFAKPLMYGGISVASIIALFFGISNIDFSSNTIDNKNKIKEVAVIEEKKSNNTSFPTIDTLSLENEKDSITDIIASPIQAPVIIPENEILIENNRISEVKPDEILTNIDNIQIDTLKATIQTVNNIPNIKEEDKTITPKINDLQLTNVTIKIINKKSVSKSKPSNSPTSDGQLKDSKNKTKKGFEANKMPEPQGGDEGLSSYLKNKVLNEFKNSPELKNRTTVVSFVVNNKGSIISATTSTSIDKVTDKKIKNIILNQPSWKPADSRGKMEYYISITF